MKPESRQHEGIVAKLVRRPVAAGALLLAVWAIPWIARGYSAHIDGERYFWLSDDPMISLRYAHNLAHGLGLVWNPGERIEGYSNFLWTLLMVPFQWLPVAESKQAIFAFIANIAFAVLGLAVLHRIAKRLHPDPVFAAVVVLACAANGTLFEWMIRGFETPLLVLLLLFAFDRLLDDLERGQPRLATHLAIMLPSLVRFDALLVCGLMSGWAVLRGGNRRRAVLFSVASLAIPMGETAFRLIYYGDWLPNTAYLKAFGWAGKTKRGIRYVIDFCEAYPLLVLSAGLSLLWVRQSATRALAVGCAIFGGYVAYVGGDFFKEFRFLAPAIPFLLLAAFATVWNLTNADSQPRLLAQVDRRFRASPWKKVVLVLGIASAASATFLWWRSESYHSHRAYALSGLAAVGLAVAAYAAAVLRSERTQHQTPAHPRNALRFAWVVLVLAGTRTVASTHPIPKPYRAYEGNIHIANYLREHTPANAKVADIWAGAVFYFSHRQGIDFLGKCDRHVAHGTSNPASNYPGHNKFDYDYSIGQLHPDYVVSSFKLPVTEAEMRDKATGDLACIGALYFNPAFRRHCLPHPVDADTWRTIFRCDWSESAAAATEAPPL
jgi:hypothetical protein